MNAEYYIRQLNLYDILGYTKDPNVNLLIEHINNNFLNLTIKDDNFWYNQNNEKVIYQDLKTNHYYLHYSKLWSFLVVILRLEYSYAQALTKYILETHYKLKDITANSTNFTEFWQLEAHYKLNNITTDISKYHNN